jgi:hypothetical protein
MKAVEIQAPPPRPPHFRRDGVAAKATSFSSISTLSSVPTTSQSSSKRIVKNGIYAVTNSDSGSDDSTSSDELPDVVTLISPRKRRKLSPPDEKVKNAIPTPTTLKPTRRSARISDESTRESTPRMRSRSPLRKTYKHSLANMVRNKQKAAKSEARLQEAEEAFVKTQRQREDELQQQQPGLSGDLKAVAADDSDQGERMRLAIARTEALQDENSFYFFRSAKKSLSMTPWPTIADESTWRAYGENEQQRREAFLSGFVAQLAEMDELADGICDWIAAELCHEPREDLCEAYLEVLRSQSTKSAHVVPNYATLGYYYNLAFMNQQSSNGQDGSDKTTLMDEELMDLEIDEPPPRLKYVLDLVGQTHTGPSLNPQDVAVTLCHLILALGDTNVNRNITSRSNTQTTIQRILEGCESGPRFDELCKQVQKMFSSSTPLSRALRCNVISSIPAYSERSHYLRRILALHMIVDRADPEQYIPDVSNGRWADLILTRLNNNAEFAVTESSDYALLASLTSVLDIAIDAGFSDFAFRSQEHDASRSTDIFSKRSPASTAEADFNAQIDGFTSQLRIMSSRIRDTGTSHLRRTEAKNALERLILRLEHCVRARLRPRKGVFGDVTSQQRAFLSGFLGQNKDDQEDELRPAISAKAVVPGNGDSKDSRVDEDAATAGASDADSV